MSENDGGPAFPLPPYAPGYQGMSLRDYFAAQAMMGIIASSRVTTIDKKPCEDSDMVAIAAFNQADAMLKARLSSPAAKEKKL